MDLFKKYRISTQLFLFAVSVCLIMALRHEKIDFVSNSLWAEDGILFYKDALDHGVRSVTMPYAGYLHLYPRLTAMASLAFSPLLIPFVFFGGWLASIVLMFWTLRNVFSDHPNRSILAFMIPLVALMQPHSGETFLSITNAQWWLASSLAVVASMPWKFDARYSPLVLALSLTGPFSILVLPVAAIQGMRHKSYTNLAAISIGAAIQIFILTTNPRPSQLLDHNLYHWLQNLEVFLTFGGATLFSMSMAIIFWGGFALSMRRPADGTFAITLCAALVYAASMYSLKGIPAELSPVANGARYFVVPYTLIVITLFINMKISSPVRIFPYIAMAALFTASFKTVTQADMNYQSYARLSDFESSVMIPTAPFIENQPGYFIPVTNKSPRTGDPIQPRGTDDGKLVIAKGICSAAHGVGFAADLTVEKDGYITLQWRDSSSADLHSIRRYYLQGKNRIQFAFPKGEGPVELLLESNGTISPEILKNGITACF